MTREELAAIGVIVTESEHALLARYLELLLDENTRLNLTGVRDVAAAWSLHIADSLAVAERLRALKPAALLDFGSGGGVPGIPLAIISPATRVTLLDATRKKMDAAGRIIAQLKLENVTTAWGRAETLSRSAPFRHGFDVVAARAVGPLDNLLTHAESMLKLGGVGWFWKSLGAMDEEIAAAAPIARRKRMSLCEPIRYRLPDPHGERVVLEYQVENRAVRTAPS